MLRICTSCRKPIRGDSNYCPGCGAKVVLSCPSCEATIGRKDRFCSNCGARTTQKERNTDKASFLEQTESLNIENEAEAEIWDQEVEKTDRFNPYYLEAVRIVKGTSDASISNIQKCLCVTNVRAEQYIDIMEQQGIVSPIKPDGTRDIFADIEPGYKTIDTPEPIEDWPDPDPLYDQAVEIVFKTSRPSISSLQRILRIPYNRAARLIERMEEEDLVSPVQLDGKRTLIGTWPDDQYHALEDIRNSGGFVSLLRRFFR